MKNNYNPFSHFISTIRTSQITSYSMGLPQACYWCGILQSRILNWFDKYIFDILHMNTKIFLFAWFSFFFWVRKPNIKDEILEFDFKPY